MAAGGLLALADDLLNLLADCFQRNPQGFEGFGSNAFAFMNQSKQNVFGADVIMVEHAGFFLSQHNNPSGPIGKALKHRRTPLLGTE